MAHMGFQIPGMPPPQLHHQPPQIFGVYGPDGLPIQHHQMPPDMSAQMFGDAHLFVDDPNDTKKRRIARACDMCRKKKIKCDGKMPSCTHCTTYKTDCVFTQVEKKRAPPKGAKYIEGLENRLGRMEHILRLSGILGEDDEDDLGAIEKRLSEKHRESQGPSAPTSPSQAPSGHATPATGVTSPGSQKDKDTKEKRKSLDQDLDPIGDEHKNQDEEEVAALSEMMCSLVTNQSGETRYIGSSSGFSIFSPKGISWVNERTGDTSFQHMISEVSVDDHKWTNWKPEVFNDLFPRPIFRPLPPKAEAISLLKDYFENFNCMFPLFHQPTFMHLVERQYSGDPYQGSGWWASLNVALAISHRLRVMSNLVGPDEDDKAWGYLKNAMGVFSELTMRNTDLLSVQALLGMASFMQGTPNPQPAFLLVAVAIRLAHSIGLHKRGTGFNLNPIEVEQRKRVFWIAYMLDKDLCLRAGRPPAQDDDDMNVDLPDEDPEDQIGNIPLADGKGKMNLFRVMCEFTVIESKVYKRLYSTKATKQTTGELLKTIGELDEELEAWKDSIPIDFRPEHEINASHTPLILHVVMLHFAYYNCLTTIHRMSIHRGYWTSRLSDYAIQGLNSGPVNPRIFSSAALCTAAARASISLLKYIPQGDFSCVWMILYFPVSALVTLFGNILQNPLDARAKSDTKLMNLVVNFLSMLGQEAEQGGVHRMLAVCSEFERIAKVVIERTEKEQGSRRKRKTAGESAAAAAAAATGKSSSSAAASETTPRAHATPTPRAMATPGSGGGGAASGVKRDSIAQLSPYNEPSPQQEPSPNIASAGWPQEFPVPQPGEFINDDFSNQFYGMASPPNGGVGGSSHGAAGGAGMGGGGAGGGPPMGFTMQNPLLPQDLFSLPMTLDWSWAEMSGGAYPTVENGKFEGSFGGQQQ